MNPTLRTPDRFAYRPFSVDSIDRMPETLKDLAAQNLPAGEDVSFIFVIPSAVYSHGKEPEQALLFCTHGLLHVQANDSAQGRKEATFIRSATILRTRVSLILLYGCLEIDAADGDRLIALKVEYHSSGHEKFWPVLADFLEQVTQDERIPAIDPQVEKNAWEAVHRFDLKFINGLTSYTLLPAEHLAGAVYQPEIRQPIILGLSRQLVPPTLLVLSDRQVVSIGEPGKGKHEKYGWVIDFYPRFYIQDIRLQPQEAYAKILIQVERRSHQETQELLLTREKAEEWISLWNNRETLSVESNS